MITTEEFNELRNELSIKSKNGVDFIISACIIWLFIALLWTRQGSAYDKSVLTFIVGALMLPLALLLSKLLKTKWTNSNNPLQPFGLWLNISQLLYFPFLVYALAKAPEYFVMMYVIITGAHLFPYAWFYKTNIYAIFAGIIAVGAVILGLLLKPELTFVIPLFMSFCAAILAILLYCNSKRKAKMLGNA